MYVLLDVLSHKIELFSRHRQSKKFRSVLKDGSRCLRWFKQNAYLIPEFYNTDKDIFGHPADGKTNVTVKVLRIGT